MPPDEPSALFYTDRYRGVEVDVQQLLNDHEEFLSEQTANSTRAVGDAIEDIIGNGLQDILGDFCSRYSAEFARRAMEDIAFEDTEGFYYVLDVKTHRLDTAFSMPNLTSVRRLARFYEDDRNYFAMLMAKYNVEGTLVNVENVHLIPLEFLDWACLNIGALGWGQIQIQDANEIAVNDQYSRKTWMLELCEHVNRFYEEEIGKIGERQGFFQDVREQWEEKQDIWSQY